MDIRERLQRFFREKPSPLALEREGEITAVLARYEEGFQRLPTTGISGGSMKRDVKVWRRRGTSARLEQAHYAWEWEEGYATSTTTVAFGTDNTIREVRIQNPSEAVVAASGIDVLRAVLPQSPGLIQFAAVEEIVIRPVIKRGEGKVGTAVEMSIRFQHAEPAPSQSPCGWRAFTLRLPKTGTIYGDVTQDGRRMSSFIYPDFNMAKLTDTALHEAFPEVPQEAMLHKV